MPADLTLATAQIDVAVRPRVEHVRPGRGNRPAGKARGAAALAAPAAPAAPAMRPDRSVVLDVKNRGDHVLVKLVPNAAALAKAAEVLAAAAAKADGAVVDVVYRNAVVASTDARRVQGKREAPAAPAAPAPPVVVPAPAPPAPAEAGGGKPAGSPGKGGGG